MSTNSHRGSSPTNQERRAELAERAAALFRGGMSYGNIAKELNLTKPQAKSKVRAGLGCSPAAARQNKGVQS